MKQRWKHVLIGLVFSLVIVFHKQITTYPKVALLILQEFPNISVKPLNLIPEPIHQKAYMGSDKKVSAEIFTPQKTFISQEDKLPVLILAVGVRLSTHDRQELIKSAKNLSKLGYVVFVPRKTSIEQGKASFESTETFIDSFKYAEKMKGADSKRISFLGFSTGASLSLIAASDPYLKPRLHALVFFAGYYNIFDYLQSLFSQKVDFAGKKITWSPKKEIMPAIENILKSEKAENVIEILKNQVYAQEKNWFRKLPVKEIEALERINPAAYVNDLSTRVFIIHDKNDSLVPYFDAEKLNQAISTRVKTTIVLTDFLNHVKPEKNPHFLETLEVYGFFYKVFEYL